MSDETDMRTRLQRVAAYRELQRGVRRSGRENVVFAVVMVGLAYFTFQPNAGGFGVVVFVLYLGLAAAELGVGLLKWAFPAAEGVLLDALVWLLFAGWNLGWQGLALAAGVPPNGFIFIGLYTLFGAFSRFKSYLALRRLFAERPLPEHVAWFNELVREVQFSDPDTDTSAIDLPTRPRWKAKLLGAIAFFVADKGNRVWLVGPDDFTLKREKTDHGNGLRRAVLGIYGETYPEFDIDDTSWANYTRWMAAQQPGYPA